MKIILNDDGSAEATNAHEGNENPAIPAEGIAATPAAERWGFSRPDQLEAHLRGIEDAKHPLAKASKGDVAAARDFLEERRKQAES